jgi:hypothetical protein
MHRKQRVRPCRIIVPLLENLEQRGLLASGAANVIAVIPATVASPGGSVEVPFAISRTEFRAPKGRILIGIDISAQNGSPTIVSVDNARGSVLHTASHATYDPSVSKLLGKTTTSAALATVSLPIANQASQYAVRVQETDPSSGPLRLGFFLPGDANGDGIVDRNDIKAIRTAMGSHYGDAKYSISADADRDGKIDQKDLRYAQRNLGVRTVVTPVFTLVPDTTYIDPRHQLSSQSTLNFSGTATPGATITLEQQQSQVPRIGTTADSSGHFQIAARLAAGLNTFVGTMTDQFGQHLTMQTMPVYYEPMSVGS